MAKNIRDEFKDRTKRQIEKSAGRCCSDPSCRRPTRGPSLEGTGEINLGVAAHICAAAIGGPRYDENQTCEQRSSAANGIWLCQNHAHAIDVEESKFTELLLREWKKQAKEWAWRRVVYDDLLHTPVVQAHNEDELSARLHAATAADLDVFRRLDKWPSTAIALTLEVDGLSGPVSATVLATALSTLDDLILVAPPGMGKTTTLFQIAEAVLANGNASPIVVPLGDWSTDGASLLESVLKRPAFRGLSEDNLRAVAEKSGVILLLDGWNELDTIARKRLAVQVARLQAELPELSLLISTRKQVLDVPVNGTRINLLPLNETQQLDIAKTLRGDAGLRMVDQAWRTAGVHELVTIPLYLTALLALPEDAPFPTTKEEVLRRFVAVHEEDSRSAEALADVTHGLHQRFLEDLAVTATLAANTTITENFARRSVSETDDSLVAEGQITEKPQPNTVLEALVSHHVLIRLGEPAGYSFQHQQFQEWYASHFVERLMFRSIGDAVSLDKLKADILNQPAWEESILFACERLARRGSKQQEACGAATLVAFEVDPILAAEMIFRSTDAVWAQIGPTIQELVGPWHMPGKVDRALRFMISSGRPEFFDQVWPLITHENDQINLSALRAGRRFRPSLLGSGAATRIAALSPSVRKNVLHEIASNSGMDGLDLVAAIAKDDPDPEVKATVADALAFCRADRHVAVVLRCADEKTFDLVARMGLVEEMTDEHVKNGIEAAHERQRKEGFSAYDRLCAIVYAASDKDLSGDLTAVIAEMEIDKKRDAEVRLLYEMRNRYSRAIADGILQRVRAGRTLFYGADDFLASAGFSLEDDVLLEIALSDTSRIDNRAAAAASVLGPQAVGHMIEAILEARKRLRDASGKYDQVAGDRYHDLLARIARTLSANLIAAVRARSTQAGNEEIAELADLISRHPNGENDQGRPFDTDTLTVIGKLSKEWGNRMLVSGDATREQLASIVTLASHAPTVSLLPLLRRLLDEELHRYRAFREEAKATGWRQGKATDEARTVYTHAYQRAFQAIKTPETAALMREYLHDEHFGQLAALVLAAQWTAANEPSSREYFRIGVDFSRVEERRAARARDSGATSAEANAIFCAIDPLTADEATEDQKKHAVTLGVVAARLPHGQRDVTIRKLISLAPRRMRAALLQNLILSGENIDIKMVKNGIAEVFEAAKTQSWILSGDGYELKEWLRLLPFANPPAEAFAVVSGLPDNQRKVERLEEMIAFFGTAPGYDAENVLFQLAEADPKLYANHTWRTAIMHRGTLSAGRQLVDLAANGAFESKGTDIWYMARQLGGLIAEHGQLRAHVYQLLKDVATTPGLALLAQAVAENPDADGLVLLIKIEMEHKPSFISGRTIEKVVTEHVPSENWKGAYNVIPVPAVELRQKLLAMTTDCGPTDVAARCLNQIDKIRDDYGRPDSEPRHPDLASGKHWPIMMPDLSKSEA